MPKRTNRQDATIRNVRASRKRDAKQDTRLDRIERRLEELEEVCGITSTQDAPSEPSGPR